MRIAGQFQQDTPFSDGVIFFGVGSLVNAFNFTIASTLTVTPGSMSYALAASASGFLALALPTLGRTGTIPNYQEQFGTAALQPGPSSVANTSDPLNLIGMPPVKKSNLATLTGGSNGFVSKGYQVNYIDVIYQVNTNPLTSINIGITKNKFVNNQPVAASVILAYGVNGLQTAVQANPYVTRVTPTNISFVVDSDAQYLIGLSAATPA